MVVATVVMGVMELVMEVVMVNVPRHVNNQWYVPHHAQ